MAEKTRYSLLPLIPVVLLVYLMFPLLYILLVPANLSWGSGRLSGFVISMNSAYVPLKQVDDKTGGYYGRFLKTQAGDCCQLGVCYERVGNFDFQGVQVKCTQKNESGQKSPAEKK